MNDKTAVFRTESLTKTDRAGAVLIHALRGVDLALYEGEFVVLLGASGSGKSTLLNILGGLDVPSDGKVFYRDHDLALATDAELADHRHNGGQRLVVTARAYETANCENSQEAE